MAERSLRFWFDFISPYAYLAWKAAPAFCETHGLQLDPRPVLFAGLLNHWGQLGPAEVPPKRVYTFKHCVRRAARQGVPFGLPPAHPFNPLLALRVAALDLPVQTRVEIIDACFDATWGGPGPSVDTAAQRGVDSPEKVTALLNRLGHAGPELVARATQAEHKAAFRASNESAIEAGVFGVPTLAVDDELFWGSDVYEDIAARLSGQDPIDAERWAGQTQPVQGADRRRPS